LSRSGEVVHLPGAIELRRRCAHGTLVALYALAAVLGLFLHSPGESIRPRHTCELGRADLDGPEVPDGAHDAAHCSLCHLHQGLGVALLDPEVTLVLGAVPAGTVPEAPAEAPASPFRLAARSRGPPASA
jgi:hypothetical protein